PQKKGIALKLDAYLKSFPKDEAAIFLVKAVKYAEVKLNITPDDFVFELADGILGDFYPSPSRMQSKFEIVVHEYLSQIHFRGKRPEGSFDIFATEGATAAMIYIFKCLNENFILLPGEKIAIVTPIFSPYLEIPVLRDYELVPIYLHGNKSTGWQLSEKEINKLSDKSIKALFMVNPMNPGAVSMSLKSVQQLEKLVLTKRKNLIVLTDTVYCPFVDEFHDPLEKIAENCIGVYSFSKYFGVTGWRLGTIFVHKNNVLDRLLKNLPESKKELLRKRYSIVSENPDTIRFIDRLVMDSRDVALAHTGGLSTPQQCIMVLFSLFEMLDSKKEYKKSIQAILKNREKLLYEQLGMKISNDPDRTHYYSLKNMLDIAKAKYGKNFALWLKNNFTIYDVLLYISSQKMAILLPGQGFAGPEWSFRISLANLPDEDYQSIGKAIGETMNAFYKNWKQSNHK
ncbi:bifunctional aspartate transaminase/aspartate 4-decarboxylase, partial [bacterium]|nr:bifunctional aspartate transaminase/aspartate 4-decarboxylase [bacterium]